MTPKQIIQKIKDDYSPLSNTEATLSSLANATKTLADDLYAKDTHFIFELIQNAEDNEYDKGVKPALRFRLIDNNDGNTAALVIYNNEKGFLPDHVKAVCAVGRSTKKKVEGYIGEKGISLNLGDTENGSIKFVETHLCDLQAILEQHHQSGGDDCGLSERQEG